MESNMLPNYFLTLGSVQHSKRCVEVFDAIQLDTIGKGDNLTLVEVYELINVYYYRYY